MEEPEGRVEELYQLCSDVAQGKKGPDQIAMLATQILDNPEATSEMKDVATKAEAFRGAVLIGPHKVVGDPISTYHPNLEWSRLQSSYRAYEKTTDAYKNRPKWKKMK